MSRASQSSLDMAHSFLLSTILEEIAAYRNGDIISPVDGSVKRVPPALLTTLAGMLRTNRIDRPGVDKETLEDDALAAELDEFDLDNASPFRTTKTPKSNIKPPKVRDDKERLAAVESDLERRLSRIVNAWCCACKQLKPREAFSSNKARSNLLQGTCNDCERLKRDAKKAEKMAEKNEAFKADQNKKST